MYVINKLVIIKSQPYMQQVLCYNSEVAYERFVSPKMR